MKRLVLNRIPPEYDVNFEMYILLHYCFNRNSVPLYQTCLLRKSINQKSNGHSYYRFIIIIYSYRFYLLLSFLLDVSLSLIIIIILFISLIKTVLSNCINELIPTKKLCREKQGKGGK